MLYRNRFYHPTLGRFISRDPIGYEDDVNLHRYVGNLPTIESDVFGLSATILDKNNPTGCPEPHVCEYQSLRKDWWGSSPRERCQKKVEKELAEFNAWYIRNQNTDWTKALDTCPCTIEKDEKCEWKKQKGFDTPNADPIYWGYHKGADLCTRGESNSKGHATQCCYSLSEDGKTGKLITSGSGQGTVDKGKTGGWSSVGGKHAYDDMWPAGAGTTLNNGGAWFLDNNRFWQWN
jgi:hypothetical protein